MAWERLAHVALSGSGDVLDSGTFTAKKNIRVIINTIATGGATNHAIVYNSDTGSNYAYRRNADGGSDSSEGTQSSDPSISGSISSSAGNTYAVGNISNVSDKEKLTMWETTFSNSAGAGNAPMRREGVAKWANTSSQITKITVTNDSAGSYAAGSYITVFGAKEAATADSMSITGMEARKHLMIQTKVITTGGAVSQRMTFNNDTGSNYSQRKSFDGASDSTSTSSSNIDGLNDDLVTNSVGFVTYYVINEASKEKLGIAHSISGEAAGAGTAPTRDEEVFKWANTSNQITRIDFNNNKAGSYAEGTEVTVYGTD